MKGKKDDTSVIDNRPISNLLSIKYKLNQNGYYFTRGEIPLFPVMKYRQGFGEKKNLVCVGNINGYFVLILALKQRYRLMRILEI